MPAKPDADALIHVKGVQLVAIPVANTSHGTPRSAGTSLTRGKAQTL